MTSEIKAGSVIWDANGKRARIFELVVDITGPLEGGLKDWPAHIQDTIYAAMQRVAQKNGIKELHVLQSRCGRDVATEPYHIVVTIVGETIRQ